MSQRYSDDPRVDASLQASIKDGMAYTVMSGGAESYFAAWALHFGATTAQIGLLGSLPALIGSLAQLAGAELGRRIGRRITILGGASLQGLVLLPMALIPLFWPKAAVPTILAGVALYHGGVNLAAPQWASLMGDLVPEKRRGDYFGQRNRLCSLTSFLALVLAGLALDAFQRRGAATAGFLLLLGIGFLARGVSTWYLGRMWCPDVKESRRVWRLEAGWLDRLKQSPFARLLLLSGAMSFTVSISGPFFVVYMLRDLEFSYRTFMLISATTILIQYLTLQRWGQVGDRYGNKAVLKATGKAMPMMPALWLVSGHPLWLGFAQLAAGLVWAGWTLALGNFLYDLIPPEQRASRLALHSVVGGLTGFAGAGLGGWLGGLLPAVSVPFHGVASSIPLLIAISSLLRLVAVTPLIRLIDEVRTVEKAGSALIYRVIAIRPLAGLVFETVGKLRRG
jgi:MFS family permease